MESFVSQTVAPKAVSWVGLYDKKNIHMKKNIP